MAASRYTAASALERSGWREMVRVAKRYSSKNSVARCSLKLQVLKIGRGDDKDTPPRIERPESEEAHGHDTSTQADTQVRGIT
jgi:hypothetical protein